MKKTNLFINFRPSFMHVFGSLIIIAGLFLLWFSAVGAVNSKTEAPENSNVSEADEEDEENEDIIITPGTVIKSRADIAHRITIAIFGGLLVLGGVPFFYAPYAEKGHKFRRTKKEDADVDTDPEFDYPDDDFDFIIVKNVRDKLLNEKLKNIRNKRNKK